MADIQNHAKLSESMKMQFFHGIFKKSVACGLSGGK